MSGCRLYIADMDQDFVRKVRGYLKASSSIEVIGSAGNGRTALREIIQRNPDVLMTEITLPEMDGISLLKQLKRLKQAPAVIVCTRFCSDAMLQCAVNHGAATYFCKPVDLECLPEIILRVCLYKPRPSTTSSKALDAECEAMNQQARIVYRILKECGISARLHGYMYFLQAVLRCNDNALLMKNLSKGLYAELAFLMDTTVECVEHSMRTAIGIAYRRGALNSRFARKPTNREFLEYLIQTVNRADIDGLFQTNRYALPVSSRYDDDWESENDKQSW